MSQSYDLLGGMLVSGGARRTSDANAFGYDHIMQNAPDPIRTLKLSCIEPA